MASRIVTTTECTGSNGGVASAPSFAERLMRLHPAITRFAHPAGARLFAEDESIDRLYVVADGWALKSKWLIDGRRQILDFALPGDVLGSVGLRRMSHGVEMLTGGAVVVVPRGMFDAVARANPELAIEVCRQREAAEQRAYERIASISCRSARLRVCRLLVEFVERQLAPGAATGELRLPLPLKQIHIADALGLRIETICRALGQLSRTKIATLKSGSLRVADLDALRAEAERDETHSEAALPTWAPGGATIDAHPAPSLGAAARRSGPGDPSGGGVDRGEKSLRHA